MAEVLKYEITLTRKSYFVSQFIVARRTQKQQHWIKLYPGEHCQCEIKLLISQYQIY